jgi:hypothetical protein
VLRHPSSVLDLCLRLGIEVDALQPLRSTNNTVFWLNPSPIVAKVHGSQLSASRELAAGHALAQLKAPIVPPAERVGDEVHDVDDVHVTFWRYADQGGLDAPTAREVAIALHELHRGLTALADATSSRNYEEQLRDAIQALGTAGFAPLLSRPDRSILKETLEATLNRLQGAEWVVLHGSPHRMNILTMADGPVFIDLETIQLGPIEWDLAHLEPEVAHHYPNVLDEGLLDACRTAVSAATSTWCWGALDRGGDMQAHAEHHLQVVQSTKT